MSVELRRPWVVRTLASVSQELRDKALTESPLWRQSDNGQSCSGVLSLHVLRELWRGQLIQALQKRNLGPSSEVAWLLRLVRKIL